jgi:regulator of protease activity HflC (stomatin/prohibitin superfamily)
MTDTTPAVERFNPFDASSEYARMYEKPDGRWVRYSDYAALSAQLEEWKEAAQRHHPNPADFRYWEGRYRDEKARAETARAEGKAEGLREAALRVVSRKDGSVLHSPSSDLSEAHDAILDLIPADTPAAKVTVQRKPLAFGFDVSSGPDETIVIIRNPTAKVLAGLRAIAGGRDE